MRKIHKMAVILCLVLTSTGVYAQTELYQLSNGEYSIGVGLRFPEDMTGLDGELVRQKVIGPAGTTITITVGREGLEPFDVDVTRKSIVAPSVEAYMLDENIAYIRLYTFGDKSHEQIRNSLNQLLAQTQPA